MALALKCLALALIIKFMMSTLILSFPFAFLLFFVLLSLVINYYYYYYYYYYNRFTTICPGLPG